MRIQVVGHRRCRDRFCGDAFAQTNAPDGWLNPDWNKPQSRNANRKPAHVEALSHVGSGRSPGAGTQAGGVQLKPNNAGRKRAAPYTSHIRSATVSIAPPARGKTPSSRPGQRSAKPLRTARSAL
jgi:hypothetical protein